MKAALYVRISSEEQINNFSISAQLTALQEYCVKNNIEVYEFYADEGISGTKEDRPAFQKMIHDAEKKLFDVILVHKFDRFARRVEISQRIKSRLKKANVNVISITEPIEDSPIGFFQEGLLELLSEYFIKNLSNEIKKGQKERASQGYHHGSVPYGYRTKDGVAYIIEEEAEIIRQIYELYLKGWGYSKISKYFNDIGIKTTSGCFWQHHQIYRILRNKVYCGYTYLNKVYYKSDFIPVIISEETFETAQRERGVKGVRYIYRTNRQNEFLFLGMIKCAECGCAIRVHFYHDKKNRDSNSYVCNTASRYSMDFKCKYRKYISVKKFDRIVLAYLRDIASGKKIERKTKRQTVKIVDIVDNYSTKILDELKRAKAAYLKGTFDLEEYSQEKVRLEKELKGLSSPLQLETVPVIDIDISKEVKTVMEQFDKIPEENIIERKKLLRTIIDYVSIGKDGINVYFL